MELTQIVFLVLCICLCSSTVCAHGRLHNHKKHKHEHAQTHMHIAMPPSLPPEPVNLSPSLPSEPPIAGPGESLTNSTCIFDVRSFGAIGDAVTDDTQAFKSAWEAACQVESGILLVPNGYSFMIQAMIFAGPCQNGFTFQVHLLLCLRVFWFES